MSESRIVVMIHIDALRHDYVTPDEMPFLYELGQQGLHKRLIPPFGFEPDGAYLTGREPEEYNGGAHFVLRTDPDKGIPFSRTIPSLLDHLNIYIQYPVRRLLEKLISLKAPTQRIQKQPFIGYIPFRLIKYFDYCEYYSSESSHFSLEFPTIFDQLREQGWPYFYHGPPIFPSNADKARERVLRELNGRHRFAFLFISDLDSTGHLYGPDSPERKRTARYVDQTIREIYQHLQTRYAQIDIIAFGDHGMVPVTQTVDLRPLIKSLPLKLEKDYVYFLDSTFARFWAFTEEAAKILVAELARIPEGKVMDDEERRRYRVRYRDNRFGDIIFWVNEGVMIFPNFWHARRPKKGMHGYRREVINNHAALVTNFPIPPLKGLPDLEMKMVYHITCHRLFQIPIVETETVSP